MRKFWVWERQVEIWREIEREKNKLCTNGDEEVRNGCTLIVGWGVGRRVRIGNIGEMCHGILSKLVMTGGCWS